MNKERIESIIIWGASSIGLYYLALGALSRAQRLAILERDEHTSQMRHYSEEKGWHTGGYCVDGGENCTDLHVHHIIPQREGGSDEPENLITLFACEHVGVCKQQKIRQDLAR